jgi:hypothetical protein
MFQSCFEAPPRSPLPVLLVALSLLLIGLLAPARVAADIITLASGRKIEGKVVSEDAEYVRIETKTGVQAIAREDIASIEKISDPKAEIGARRKALEARSASAKEWYELGLWAEGNKLDTDAKACFESAIKTDPDHTAAREKLCYERVGGAWLPDQLWTGLNEQSPSGDESLPGCSLVRMPRHHQIDVLSADRN